MMHSNIMILHKILDTIRTL